jgi:phytoene desaturase
MPDKSIIIIGAGLAGLATGVYAQACGYRTHIFEHHTLPGGVCTAWKRKSYNIDGCIHWLMGAQPGMFSYKVYREVGALEGNRLTPIDYYARAVIERSETSLEITADLDRLVRDVRALSPADAPALEEIVAASRDLAAVDMVNEPAELMGPLDNLKWMWRYRRVMRYAMRYNISVAEYCHRIQHPDVRWALTNFFVPEMPMLFLFMLLGQLGSGRLAGVERGSLEFAVAIARRYLALGGKITYNATVQEILVEVPEAGSLKPKTAGQRGSARDGKAGARAVGVRLADGAEHRADIVVSAADGYATIFEMLGGRFADDATRERYELRPLFRPIIMASFGVARLFEGQPPLSMVSLARPISWGPKPIDAMSFRIFQGPPMAPPGKSVVQAIVETDFDAWWALKDDQNAYEAEKMRLAAELSDRLEAHLPGISAAVEMTDVATPWTFWRVTRNRRGAYEGWLMTKEMMTTRLPKTLPGLDNFYMAGQWVEAGGGIPAVLPSGRQVVQLICHRDGVPFTPPDEASSLTAPRPQGP